MTAGLVGQTQMDNVTVTEPSTRWVKSKKCLSNGCVEVCSLDGLYFAVRDTKQNHMGPEQPILILSRDAFAGLLSQMIRSTSQGTPSTRTTRTTDGTTTIRSLDTGVELRFDQDEIDAFVAGIKAGEFTPEALMQPVG